MANDYDTLLARVPKWLYAQNQSLVTDMPQIIQEAQDQIMGVLSHDIFTVVAPLTASATGELDLTGLTPVPLEVRGINVLTGGRYVPIERRDFEMLSMLYPTNRGGTPRYYGESNGPLIVQLFPVPAAPAVTRVRYNATPAYLTATAKTNAITTYAFRAMEKATMRQASLYMKDWQMAEVYKAEMTEAIVEANAQISRRHRDDTGTKPSNAPVNATGS
jgi:hypothetical protein